MSLRDRLRRRGDGGDEDGGDGRPDAPEASEPATAASARDDITDFDPHSDGDYRCTERGLLLRFARPVVLETDAEHADPARGEFTQSGRFVVQRPFDRPIVYTVLDYRPGVMVVRRTDTSVTDTDGTTELEFVFEPDER
jgi:hypothetical protein